MSLQCLKFGFINILESEFKSINNTSVVLFAAYLTGQVELFPQICRIYFTCLFEKEPAENILEAEDDLKEYIQNRPNRFFAASLAR